MEYDTLYRLVLNKIRECAKAALTDRETIARKLTNTCEVEQKGQREALERSLTKDEERIEVLEKMVLRLYEDMVAQTHPGGGTGQWLTCPCWGGSKTFGLDPQSGSNPVT